MVLGELRGMGVGSNARKREKCQAGKCRIKVGGNLELDWKRIESSWKEIGNKLERIGEVDVNRGVGGNARSRGKCQAGQCLMGIGMRLEKVGKDLRT